MSPRCLVDRSCLGTSTSSNLISKQREWLLKILLYPKMLIPCQTAAGSLISSFYDATSRVDPKPIAIFHFKQLPTYQLLISPGVILPGSSWVILSHHGVVLGHPWVILSNFGVILGHPESSWVFLIWVFLSDSPSPIPTLECTMPAVWQVDFIIWYNAILHHGPTFITLCNTCHDS